MSIPKKKTRFESEVHLGLLAIVFFLLLLNFVTNVVIYKARADARESTAQHLRSAGLVITRSVHEKYPHPLTKKELSDLRESSGLSSLIIVPSELKDGTIEARRRWFASITSSLPAGQLPDLAQKLISSDIGRVTQGADEEYFMVSSIALNTGVHLMIASVNNPTLAFLDGSGMIIIIVSVLALLAVAAIYLGLYKYIFSPFKKIRDIASRAGRVLPDADTSVEELVADYRKIIGELEADKEKLHQLNETISSHAQSLEQFNDYLLNSIESGIITLDRQGKVITISSKAAAMLSVEPIDYHGRVGTELFGSCPTLRLDIQQAIEGNRIPCYQEHHLNRPGEGFSILGVTMSIVLGKDQKPIGLAILINDHSELYRLRKELEARKRLTAMGEMAGGLAHQLRNSLGAITGFGTLIKRKLTNVSVPTKTIEQLLDEAIQAERLIGQFLGFTRPFPLAAIETELDQFLTELIDAYRSREEYSHIEFHFEPAKPLVISFDPLLLKQAVTNLIDNAVQAYDSEPGIVSLSILPEIDQVCIEVRDSGCGIPEEDLDQIFTPFYSRRPSGTGLGLPLASKIVDLHGGSLEVASTEGQGTAFILTLPIKTTKEPAMALET